MKLSRTSLLGRPVWSLFVATMLLTGTTGLLAQEESVPLNPDRPDSYTVKPGDTLWDISAMFLRDPWYWPEIWYVNPQVQNPHLIYPGDVLTLAYGADGRPQLRLDRGVADAASGGRLSPRIREEGLGDALTAIPYDVVGPFLNRGLVLQKDQIRDLPYVVAIRDRHLMAAAGNDLYVRGAVAGPEAVYSVVRVGEKLVDPDDGDVVGYEGVYVGQGTVRRGGDPSTMMLNASTREALEGDRLLDAEQPLSLTFFPRAPDKQITGRIIHVVDGVTQIGQYQVIVINRGSVHGLAPGHVLTVWQAGEKVTDRHRRGILNTGFPPDKVRLPDERAGTLMVFKTFDRISYGLVMQAEAPIHTLDKVSNPS